MSIQCVRDRERHRRTQTEIDKEGLDKDAVEIDRQTNRESEREEILTKHIKSKNKKNKMQLKLCLRPALDKSNI